MTNTVLIASHTPAFELARKGLDAAQSLFETPASALTVQPFVASQPYPWLTDVMRNNMSVRAQRLLRADY